MRSAESIARQTLEDSRQGRTLQVDENERVGRLVDMLPAVCRGYASPRVLEASYTLFTSQPLDDDFFAYHRLAFDASLNLLREEMPFCDREHKWPSEGRLYAHLAKYCRLTGLAYDIAPAALRIAPRLSERKKALATALPIKDYFGQMHTLVELDEGLFQSAQNSRNGYGLVLQSLVHEMAHAAQFARVYGQESSRSCKSVGVWTHLETVFNSSLLFRKYADRKGYERLYCERDARRVEQYAAEKISQLAQPHSLPLKVTSPVEVPAAAQLVLA